MFRWTPSKEDCDESHTTGNRNWRRINASSAEFTSIFGCSYFFTGFTGGSFQIKPIKYNERPINLTSSATVISLIDIASAEILSRLDKGFKRFLFLPQGYSEKPDIILSVDKDTLLLAHKSEKENDSYICISMSVATFIQILTENTSQQLENIFRLLADDLVSHLDTTPISMQRLPTEELIELLGWNFLLEP